MQNTNSASVAIAPATGLLPTVAVLAGGTSAERKISLQSGAAVSRVLREAGYQVYDIDPALQPLPQIDWRGIHVAFLALHGAFGEDGQVQSILDELGVPYTGSGMRASQLAFSKSAAKERFLQLDVPTPSYVLIHHSDTAREIREQAHRVGFPLVVKPDTQGSSLGVTLVATEEELPAALASCFALDDFGLLETAILGSEWTAGMLDDDVLPLIRIETDRSFFDYEAKYLSDTTRYLLDDATPPQLEQRLIAAARGACRALGTSGLARVDMRVDRLGQPWVLEVNTIPGLTDHSLVPKAAAHRGWSFADLCRRCIDAALQQHKIRRAA